MWRRGRGGIDGRQNPTKCNVRPPPSLSVILVKYIVASGGGVLGGRQNPSKDHGAPLSLFH